MKLPLSFFAGDMLDNARSARIGMGASSQSHGLSASLSMNSAAKPFGTPLEPSNRYNGWDINDNKEMFQHVATTALTCFNYESGFLFFLPLLAFRRSNSNRANRVFLGASLPTFATLAEPIRIGSCRKSQLLGCAIQ